MAIHFTEPTPKEAEARVEVGSRVAGQLADAVPDGPEAAMTVARSLTDEEVLVGLAFLVRVTQVTAASARALTDVQEEREIRPGPVVKRQGWH